MATTAMAMSATSTATSTARGTGAPRGTGTATVALLLRAQQQPQQPQAAGGAAAAADLALAKREVEDKPIPMRVRRKELRVRVQEATLRRSEYFAKLLDGPWKAGGDAVLDFPSLRMLEAFWTALCCFVSPREHPPAAARLTPGMALQVHTAASLIGVPALQDRAERFLLEHMRESLVLSAFQACERFHRTQLKRRLFRWLCFSGALAGPRDRPGVPALRVRDGGIEWNGAVLAAGQFYDVLREDLAAKRRFFLPGDCRSPEQRAADEEAPAPSGKPPPYGDLCSCYVERIRAAGGDGEETHFVMRSQRSGQVLLAACHVVGSNEFLFASGYPSRFERADLDFLGCLESSFTGRTFVAFDHGVQADSPAAALWPEMVQGEHAALVYDQNVLGRIPNAMTVVVPDLRRKALPPGPGLVRRFEQGQLDGLLVLRTRKPSWNARTHSWTMDFHGRVKVSSKKNFKIMESRDERDGEWLMLFGKVCKHRFSLDFRAPLSAMQCLSIALSTFADKLMVT